MKPPSPLPQEAIVPSQLLPEIESEAPVGSRLTQKVKIALIAHFINAVPIANLHVDVRTKNYVAMVDHVYWIIKKNPFLDSHATFYQLSKQHYKGEYDNRGSAHHLSKYLDEMLKFVIDNIKPDSRRLDEMKVRHAADALMRRGLANDNGRDIAKGAELLTKVARLDQPESEQADMSRVAFLPPVVTTNVSEVDDTKEYIDDEQSLAIMREFGAYIDEKRTMVEDRVAVLEAKSATSRKE